MRISDWSSDVCSSDLFQALLPSLVRDRLHGTEITYGLCLAAFGAGSIFAALWVGQARRRWGSDRVVTTASLIFAAAMLPVALTTSLQIGSASCRERVCQYVSISFVAVSLK